MIAAHAPLQLPFTPKPIRRELFSSWLLRLAFANCVSLEELLMGLQARYSSAPCLLSLDLKLDDVFLNSMARISRLPFKTLKRMSLEQQVADPEAALLLRFNNVLSCPRQLIRRLGYAFCRDCIAHQSFIHVPWEWTFACLLHCSMHNTLLVVGCRSCGDLDPLPFGSPPVSGRVPCRSCAENLLDEPFDSSRQPYPVNFITLQRAYRAALLGGAPGPALSAGGSGNQFRRFVDDTLRLLVEREGRSSSSGFSNHKPVFLLPSRSEMLGTVSQLVLNASPDCDMYERRARYRKSLKLWKPLLVPLNREQRLNLARASHAWPSDLHRRFAAAFVHISRSR